MFQGTFDLETATPIDAGALSDVLFERGLYWASGRSGLVDLVAAHKWFNLAALKGRKDAVTLRQEVAGQMSDADISAAQGEGGRGSPPSERGISFLVSQVKLIC